MPVDPNLVTAETAVKPTSKPDDKTSEPAVEVTAGTVLKKGAPPPKPTDGAPGEELVKVRITKAGHGEVHDGEEGRYNWNDEVMLPRSVADSLEGRHYAEVQA